MRSALGAVVAAAGLFTTAIALYYQIDGNSTISTRNFIIILLVLTLVIVFVAALIYSIFERIRLENDATKRENNSMKSELDRMRIILAKTRGESEVSKDLHSKVPILKDKLEERDFNPDLIVGIARTGMVTAAQLSGEFKRKPRIPITSLWPNPNYNYDNCLNGFDFIGQNSPVTKKDILNVLIVDDICKSGKHLQNARRYLEDKLDCKKFKIETAAISCYHYDHPDEMQILPTFYVDRPTKEINDSIGYKEPR